MSGKVFLDTNVLIYAATGREAYPAKFRRAREIVASDGDRDLDAGDWRVRQQCAEAEENGAAADARPRTAVWVNALFRFPLIEVDRQIVETALIVQRRYQLSYWDSQIIAAAERLGADVLYSEDLNHGQIYGSVRCENPFRSN